MNPEVDPFAALPCIAQRFVKTREEAAQSGPIDEMNARLPAPVRLNATRLSRKISCNRIVLPSPATGERRSARIEFAQRSKREHEADRTFPPSSWFARWHPVPARATARNTGGKDTVATAKPDAFKVSRCSAHQPAARLVSRLCAAMTQPPTAGSEAKSGGEWPVRPRLG